MVTGTQWDKKSTLATKSNNWRRVKKDEAFKTVCFKSLKALFSVEADKPERVSQIVYRRSCYHLGLIPGAKGN